jgi:GT2 family glycosyltransferase
MSLCLSVVSHAQAPLANLLLNDLAYHATRPNRILLTSNVQEPAPWNVHQVAVDIATNSQPLGFGANHNQAFRRSTETFFCVANPDIRLPHDPFPALLAAMKDPLVGVVAPMVVSPKGATEDSARHFPTLASLLRKAIGGRDGRYNIRPSASAEPVPVDWAAGMFLLFRASAFRDVGGFDDKFHLYYEDVDICARLWNAGWKVMVSPQIAVVHAAQRTSRRHPLYMSWHVRSMARYFRKHLGRLPDTTTASAS